MGRGWVKEDTLTLITGLAGPIAAAVWGFYAHTDSAKLKAVEALSKVRAIIVKPDAGNGIQAAAEDPTRPKIVAAEGA